MTRGHILVTATKPHLEVLDTGVGVYTAFRAPLQEDLVAARHSLAAAEATLAEAQDVAAAAQAQADAAAQQLEARARRAALLDDENRLHVSSRKTPRPYQSMLARNVVWIEQPAEHKALRSLGGVAPDANIAAEAAQPQTPVRPGLSSR